MFNFLILEIISTLCTSTVGSTSPLASFLSDNGILESELTFHYDAQDRLSQFSFSEDSELDFYSSDAETYQRSINPGNRSRDVLDPTINATYECFFPDFFENTSSFSRITATFPSSFQCEIVFAKKTYETFAFYASYFTTLFGVWAMEKYFNGTAPILDYFNFARGTGSDYFSWNNSPWLKNGADNMYDLIDYSPAQLYGWMPFLPDGGGNLNLKYKLMGSQHMSDLECNFCDANIAPSRSGGDEELPLFGDYDVDVMVDFLFDEIHGLGTPVMAALYPYGFWDDAMFGVISGIIVSNSNIYMVFTDVDSGVTSSILLRDSSGDWGTCLVHCIAFEYSLGVWGNQTLPLYERADACYAYSLLGDPVATPCTMVDQNEHERYIGTYHHGEAHNWVFVLGGNGNRRCRLCNCTITPGGYIFDPSV